MDIKETTDFYVPTQDVKVDEAKKLLLEGNQILKTNCFCENCCQKDGFKKVENIDEIKEFNENIQNNFFYTEELMKNEFDLIKELGFSWFCEKDLRLRLTA